MFPLILFQLLRLHLLIPPPPLLLPFLLLLLLVLPILFPVLRQPFFSFLTKVIIVNQENISCIVNSSTCTKRRDILKIFPLPCIYVS